MSDKTTPYGTQAPSAASAALDVPTYLANEAAFAKAVTTCPPQREPKLRRTKPRASGTKRTGYRDGAALAVRDMRTMPADDESTRLVLRIETEANLGGWNASGYRWSARRQRAARRMSLFNHEMHNALRPDLVPAEGMHYAPGARRVLRTAPPAVPARHLANNKQDNGGTPHSTLAPELRAYADRATLIATAWDMIDAHYSAKL